MKIGRFKDKGGNLLSESESVVISLVWDLVSFLMLGIAVGRYFK